MTIGIFCAVVLEGSGKAVRWYHFRFIKDQVIVLYIPSAVDHYNPSDAAHGFDHEDGPHFGDLENIEVDEDGTVSTEIKAENVSILDENLDNTLLTEAGTSLIIHSGEDDYVTQPSGDAGDPVACGVISEGN